MRSKYVFAVFATLLVIGLGITGARLMGEAMTENTSDETTEQPERVGFTVKGTEVLITRNGDSETLQIEGRVVEFYHTEKGYSLKRDVFRKPTQTLREAVERYLESEATK